MTIEQRTKNFFIGWPYYGDYVYKLNKIEFIVKNYLRKNFCNKRKEYEYAVIFDIDDTLVYTDGAKVAQNWINSYEAKYKNMIFPPIYQMIRLAKYAKEKCGLKVIIITARPQQSYNASVQNLKLFGIEWDDMYHTGSQEKKIELKRALSNYPYRYNFVLSIGDQWPDLMGLNNYLCIKLPQARDNDINSIFTFTPDVKGSKYIIK